MNNYDITLYLLDQGINYNEPDNNSYGSMSIIPKIIQKMKQYQNYLEKLGAKNTLYNNAENEKLNSKGINIKFKTENKMDEIFKKFFQRKKS